MIKKTELRVGNWVNYVDNGRNISTYNKVYAITEDIQTQNIYPIPLTPEILEKLGLKKDGVTFRLDKYILWWNGSGENEYSFMLLDERDLRENYEDIFDAFKVYSKELRKISYLHQLQNLFFALTGQELSVNIDKEIAA